MVVQIIFVSGDGTVRCGGGLIIVGASFAPTLTMSTTDAQEQPKQRPAGSGRLPSLNQLAARINLNNGASASTNINTANRPRLAASLLRTGTGSTTSLSTVATNDSTAVNVPTTRPASPGSTISVPGSNTGSVTDESIEPGDDQLTAEKLEKLEKDTQDPTPAAPLKKTRVGYKNIPNLETIAARIALSRQLSIDGSAKPPEPETIEDPKTPGLRMQAPELPLEYPWSVFEACDNTPSRSSGIHVLLLSGPCIMTPRVTRLRPPRSTPRIPYLPPTSSPLSQMNTKPVYPSSAISTPWRASAGISTG